MNAKTTDEILVPAAAWLKSRGVVARPEATLEELNIDSLDMVEITMAVEEGLNIIIRDEDIELREGATLQELLEAIALHSSK